MRGIGSPAWVAAALALAVAGCSDRASPAARATVVLPEFDVRVALSEADAAALRSAGESVVVRAFFDGDGDGDGDAPPRTCDPFRAVFLGAAEVELRGEPWTASFRGVRAAAGDVARLSDPNFHVTLNVHTGRRSAPDNFLWAPAPVGRIEDLRGRTIDVSANLTSPPPPRRR